MIMSTARETSMASRFAWHDTLASCAEIVFGKPRIQRSLLCANGGTESDCSGGLGAWEQATRFVDAGFSRRHIFVDLGPASICDTLACLRFCLLFTCTVG